MIRVFATRGVLDAFGDAAEVERYGRESAAGMRPGQSMSHILADEAGNRITLVTQMDAADLVIVARDDDPDLRVLCMACVKAGRDPHHAPDHHRDDIRAVFGDLNRFHA